MQSFQDRKTTTVTMILSIHHLPSNTARKLLKPSTDSGRLLVQKVLNVGIPVGDVTMGAYFRVFLAEILTLVANPTSHFLVHVFRKLEYDQSI